jgi:hypothetical protein
MSVLFQALWLFSSQNPLRHFAQPCLSKSVDLTISYGYAMNA